MKKLLPFLLCLSLLGCGAGGDAMEEALALRGRLLASDCTFRCTVTADYGDTFQTFTLDCESDPDGELEFTVAAPESIAGIRGSVEGSEGQLEFEDQILAFPLPDQDRISPLSAPWVLMQTLRRGHITSVGRAERGLILSINDSYADDALNLEIWTDEGGTPIAGEISLQGRRMVSMEIEGFTYG